SMKNILITGANGGIGYAIAEQAIQAGYNLALHYHKNDSNIDDLISNNQNKKIIKVKADISNESDVIIMFEKINNHFGCLDALINNASTIFPKSRLEDMDIKRLEDIFKTNTIGNILCAKHVIKHMSTKHGHNGGKIINISSAASRLGAPNEYIDYACTKGAIDTLTTGLSLELADENILVNCIRPGFIDTKIHAKSGDPDRVERLKHNIPLKRAGKASEVASAAIWLLSDGANYCTGTFIDIAGGK
ncbi:hypothetical protein EGW08_022838, partial [Elysia chlorotica]